MDAQPTKRPNGDTSVTPEVMMLAMEEVRLFHTYEAVGERWANTNIYMGHLLKYLLVLADRLTEIFGKAAQRYNGSYNPAEPEVPVNSATSHSYVEVRIGTDRDMGKLCLAVIAAVAEMETLDPADEAGVQESLRSAMELIVDNATAEDTQNQVYIDVVAAYGGQKNAAGQKAQTRRRRGHSL